MAPTPAHDYSDLTALLQTVIAPLVAKIQSLEEKVDKISEGRVVRSDLDALRQELMNTLVPRDSYEPRHTAIIERSAQLETMIRTVDDKVGKQQEVRLGSKDRIWLRISQAMGVLAAVGVVVEWLLSHTHFSW
jgi:hypothetical protein